MDHFIISDEEIIEDAHFNGKFSARTQPFRLNLYLNPLETNSYEDEMKATKDLMSKVNKILAHYSPVIIIQKFMRGYLDRKFAKMYRKARIW